MAQLKIITTPNVSKRGTTTLLHRQVFGSSANAPMFSFAGAYPVSVIAPRGKKRNSNYVNASASDINLNSSVRQCLVDEPSWGFMGINNLSTCKGRIEQLRRDVAMLDAGWTEHLVEIQQLHTVETSKHELQVGRLQRDLLDAQTKQVAACSINEQLQSNIIDLHAQLSVHLPVDHDPPFEDDDPIMVELQAILGDPSGAL